jgi:hypothetical protein
MLNQKRKTKTMKKFAMFVGLALVMLATSCSTDTTEVNLNGAKVTLGVSLDQTRTYMGELNNGEYPVLWSDGDKLLVNDKVVAVPAEYVGKASVQVAVDAAEAYNVAYPAELILGNELTISEVQKYAEGSFAVGSGVMVGYSTSADAVALKNLYGYLKFTVTGAANVNAVTVVAAGGEAISGTYAIDYKNATITPLAGKDIIRVTEVVAKDGVATVVVAVPAGEYSKGFEVKVKDNANGVMVKSLKAAGATVEAGTVYAMPEVAYAATATETEITTVADLKAFIAAANAGDYSAYVSADGEVKIGADLDLTGVTLDPITTFNGIFNGQGYALKNWTSSKGLFVVNSGTVKNIVIDESCKLTLPVITATAMIGFVVDQNTGLVSGCVNNADITLNHEADLVLQYKVGAIVGYSSGAGKVSNCINNGDITMTFPAITAGSDYLGGVVGNTSMADASSVAVENCINNGDLTFTVKGASKNVYLGGISGACNSKGVINNCINNGAVVYNFIAGGSGAYPNVGGIVGYTACTINDCKNYGDVTFYSEGDLTRPAVAGIAGYVSKNVKGCDNYGNISAKGNKFAKASSATAAGAGGEQWPAFAGCFGCVGTVASNGTADISDCNNYGKVLVVNPNGSCRFAAAGVVGEPCGNVKNCHNYGDVDVTGGSQVYLGGVVGYHYLATDKVMENCSNEGDVILREGTYFYGGGGDLSDVAYQYVGGLVGSYNKYTNFKATNCVNKGEVKSVCRLPVLIGGLVGCIRGTFENCENYGDVINENGYGTKLSATAGIAGFGGGSSLNCANYGNVTMTNATGLYAASALLGVVGNTEQSHVGTTLKCAVSSNLGIALLVAGQSNNGKTVTLGTAEAPITLSDVSLNGVAVTADNLATTTVAVNTEEANVANLVYELGTTVVIEGDAPAPAALSIDGKRWQLPSDIAEMLAGVPTAVVVADLGVSVAGQLAIAVDYESVYGAQAAGYWAPMVMVAYEVQATDATSGKVLVKQTDHFGDVTNVEVPYSNLTADSVVIDFTNILGMPGTGSCTLYTGEVNLSGGGVM